VKLFAAMHESPSGPETDIQRGRVDPRPLAWNRSLWFDSLTGSTGACFVDVRVERRLAAVLAADGADEA
jgi:hypothetical protein